MKEYTRHDIEQFTSATESNLTHWTKIGLLRADLRESHGTGHHRRFSFRVLPEAEIAAQLNEFGVPVAGIKPLIEMFRFFSTGTPRLERSTDTYRRWYRRESAEHPDDLSRLCELWKAFVEPTRRHEFGFVGLIVSPRTGRWWFCIDRVEEPFLLERVAAAFTLVINIGEILTNLEDATGDRWPSAEKNEVEAKPAQKRTRRT